MPKRSLSRPRRAQVTQNLRSFGISFRTLLAPIRVTGSRWAPCLMRRASAEPILARWEKASVRAGQDAVVFAPGNEEECRKQIDLVVAADPRTYTLGDPTGPLVILRVPNEDELPPKPNGTAICRGLRWR